MKRPLITLSIACVFIFAGCGGGGYGESLSRYPSVNIPGYDAGDYERDLGNADPELVYNAMCNLISGAAKYAKTLSAEDADPESEAYQRALAVYSDVRTAAGSKDPLLVAVSLRFLERFGQNYGEKQELLAVAIAAQGNQPQIENERVRLIASIRPDVGEVPADVANKLLNSKSWVVSRSAWAALGRHGSVPLLTRFEQATDERDQLILIYAMSRGLTPDEAHMLQSLALATPNPKIRAVAFKTLLSHIETEDMRDWFITRYEEFSEEERERALHDGDEVLAMAYIKKGYALSEEDLELIADCNLDPDGDEELGLHALETAILQQSASATRYTQIKAELEKRTRLKEEFADEMAVAQEQFRVEANLLLIKMELSDEERESTLDKLCKGFDAPKGK